MATVSAALAAAAVSLMAFAPVKLNLTLFFAGIAALAAAGAVVMFRKVGPYGAAQRLLGLFPLLVCGLAVYLAVRLPPMFDAVIAAGRADIAAGRADAPNRPLLGMAGGFVCMAGMVVGGWLFAETLKDHRSSSDGEVVWVRRAALVVSGALMWFGPAGAGYFAWQML